MDWSVTKEHPWGLKGKRPDFTQGEPPSWMQGWHRQNGARGGRKVHKYMRTHGSEGVTEPGRSAQADRPGPLRGLVRSPFSCTKDPSTVSCWRHRHSQDREPFAREAIHKLERGGGRSFGTRIVQLERSTHKWRRRKTPLEASPWSTVPCLAPWWGNLLICPWV
jgi:hypothetical protein